MASNVWLRVVAVAVVLAVSALVWLRIGPASWSTAHAEQKVTVTVGDRWFCAPELDGGVCDTTIQVGDTVSWDFSGANEPHTSTECGATCNSPVPAAQALWNSDFVLGGTQAPFEFTFTQAGTYLYYCQIHPTEQRGRIIVQGGTPPPAATATSTPPPPTPTPTRTRTPTPPLAVGDVNGDGHINSADALLILQYDAGLIPTLPR